MEWIDTFNGLVGESDGDIGWAEMSVRGLVIFLYGLVATRLGAWRAFGRWSSPDIIVAIIIGSNLSRALTGPAPLVATIVATTVFILAWWLVSYSASRSEKLDWLFKGAPIRVIANGSVDEAAMRKALLSRRDLEEGLRGKGVVQADRIVTGIMERNGSITVIRQEDVK